MNTTASRSIFRLQFFTSRNHIRRRYFNSNIQTIAENDIVIIRKRSAVDGRSSKLSKPLKIGGTVQTKHGMIPHEDIIGLNVRSIVRSNAGSEMIVNFPTLEEYITLSNRLVTPIYPMDAAAIVTLLDLHVVPPTSADFETMEVLEAGTGHGSLTLHLARAMQAGNANPLYQGVRLHTIEKDAKVSKLARENIRNFRRGVYNKGVEFHVGDVGDWLKAELSKREKKDKLKKEQFNSEDAVEPVKPEQQTPEASVDPPLVDKSKKTTPFLTAALLDLPSPLPVLPLLAQALHPDAFLGYFAPSITQIVALNKEIKMQRLPFIVDKVIEFGNGMGGSLRQWDVRLARIRSRKKVQQESAEVTGTEKKPSTNIDDDVVLNPGLYETVCRPKVGGMVQGGGFYAVIRRMGNVKLTAKMSQDTTSSDETAETSSETEVTAESVDADLIAEETSQSEESSSESVNIEEKVVN